MFSSGNFFLFINQFEDYFCDSILSELKLMVETDAKSIKNQYKNEKVNQSQELLHVIWKLSKHWVEN